MIILKHKSIFQIICISLLTLFLSLGAVYVVEASSINTPSIKDGYLDLREHSITSNEIIFLDGEWEFYWMELLNPEDFRNDSKINEINRLMQIVTVPNIWSKYSIEGDNLPNYGYATYRMQIEVHEADLGEVASLYIPSVATAYTMWINGKEIVSNGNVGTSKEEMIPKEISRIVNFPIVSTDIDIIIQVSDFHQRKSGLWESIQFGGDEQILSLRERNLMVQTFVIGCIFIIGIYHIVLYFLRRKELALLYFAMVCFGIGLRASLLSDNLFAYYFSNVSWDLTVKIEYVSGCVALLFYLLFKGVENKLDMPKHIVKILAVGLLAYAVFVTIVPPYVFTNTIYIMFALAFLVMGTGVLVSLRSFYRGREGARLNLVGASILFATVLNDIFYYGHWINSDELVSFGLFFYIFIQAINLSRKFSQSFDKVEKLSLDLKELNQSLEEKVEQRTQELQKANQNLLKMEDVRKKLFASVSHELNTPLTFIQGYIKAMIDGVIARDDSTYLRSIYSDTQLMAHIITDLQELSKLESGKITFSYQLIELNLYFKQLYEKQKPVVEKRGLTFLFKDNIQLAENQTTIGEIDPARIEQVFMNLVINAKKFTLPGGIIVIELNVIKHESYGGLLRVSVIDNGPGIPEKDLPYVFNRFYKVPRTEGEEIRGAGLGLAIAKEIIEIHGGTIGVESRLEEGSHFYFTLPFHI